MNKKIIMPIALLSLLSLAIFVSAKMTPYSSDGYNHNVEIYMEKGWNLILMPDLDMRESNFMSDSDIQKEDIRAVYLYIPEHNKYYEAYPNSDELMSSINSLSQDSQNFLNLGSAWVYSDKGGYLKYRRVDVLKYNQVRLSSGWNFFTLTPELKMKKLSQFKGDCKISKIAFWQHQAWSVLDPQTLLQSSHPDTPSSWDDLVLADSDSDVGRGILFKVSSSCQFGGSSVTPPPIPN